MSPHSYQCCMTVARQYWEILLIIGDEIRLCDIHPNVVRHSHECLTSVVWVSHDYRVTVVRYEPFHEKTNNLLMRKTKLQISFEVTAKLVSAFVLASRIVQFQNPKFPASNHLLWLYRLVFIWPVRKPHCWFSDEAAHIFEKLRRNSQNCSHNENAIWKLCLYRESFSWNSHKLVLQMLLYFREIGIETPPTPLHHSANLLYSDISCNSL